MKHAVRERVGVCLALCATLLFPYSLWAGPNEGGTLVVHAPVDPAVMCGLGPDPLTCPSLLSRIDPTGAASCDGLRRVQVLAAFPAGSSPRLMGVVWGINYDPALLQICDSGKCGDFELVEAGWPGPGTGCSVTWDTPQQSAFVPVYWFRAYTSDNPVVLQITPHPSQGGWFGDDEVPAGLDPIAGYSRMGFGTDGLEVCPESIPHAACCTPDGICTLTVEISCASPGVWHLDWVTCIPSPCPLPVRACCDTNGPCLLTLESDCSPASTWHLEWTVCDPNPCPQPVYACCDHLGACALTRLVDCGAPSLWHTEWTDCSPNPCPPLVAPCCDLDGICSMKTRAQCGWPYTWHSELDACVPGLCPVVIGVCCAPGEACRLSPHADCPLSGWWMSTVTSCTPDPCDLTMAVCCWPNGYCNIATQLACPGIWHRAWTSCSPSPCVGAVPVEQTTWGRIKSRYR